MNTDTPSGIDEHDLERDNSNKEALDKSIRSSALGCAQFSLEQEYRRGRIMHNSIWADNYWAFSFFDFLHYGIFSDKQCKHLL